MQSTSAMEHRSLAKVVTTLKSAVEKFQVAQGLAHDKERRKASSLLLMQVELLQNAFASLADAVLEELEEGAAARDEARREQLAALASIRATQDTVQGRLSQVGRLEERVDGQLSAAAGLAGEVAGLAAGLRQQEAAIADLRGEVASLAKALAKSEKAAALAAADAAAAPLTPLQAKQVKELGRDLIREVVPLQVQKGIQAQVPDLIHTAVSGQCEALREDFTATATTLATDLTALAKEAGSLRGDVAAVHTLAQRADADVAAIEARVSSLEAGEAQAPKAPARLVAALEERLEALAAQQSRYSGQVEGVVKALVEDTGRLSRGVRGLEGLYSSQQMSLQDTKEALLRSAQVFSQLLKVPSPVSAAAWSRPPLSSTLAGLGGGAAGSGSGYSSHGSPGRAAAVAAGLGSPGVGGASPIRSAGAGLLAGRYAGLGL